jgi:Secretion system C-terminal sorting domain
MKKLFILFFIASPFFASSQSVTADPAVEPLKITTLINGSILATEIPITNTIKLKIPILNKNTVNGLPAGSCKIKIGLGSKLVLNPLFNFSTLNASNFFTWSVFENGGQVQIIGDLTSDLPANFNDTAVFDVKGNIIGSSTITTNFLVTNHNSTITLSDENGNNNIASIAYTIIASVLPVTFTSVVAEKKDCALKIYFDIENEINVDKYELEISKDFSSFEKIATLQSNNLTHYTFDDVNIPEVYQLPVLLVRIKAIDFDGKVQYSVIKKLSGICDLKNDLSIYPNPVINDNNFYIKKSKSLFNGLYVISIIDIAGKTISTREINLINTSNIKCNTTNIPPGQYLVKLIKKGSNIVDVFKLLKQ